LIVGLAGKACAGKDTLVPFFVERDYRVVDADRIGHRALEANQDAVLGRFGTVERPALGTMVFSDPRALADLEAITHPWIGAEVLRQVEASGPRVVINAALLHRLELWRLCDIVVWVRAPLWARVLRARSRDHWPWKRIFARIWAQRKLTPHVFPPNVDILIVDNRGSTRGSLKRLEARFGPVELPKREETDEKQ
jgi:dephospho-CoA kinase